MLQALRTALAGRVGHLTAGTSVLWSGIVLLVASGWRVAAVVLLLLLLQASLLPSQLLVLRKLLDEIGGGVGPATRSTFLGIPAADVWIGAACVLLAAQHILDPAITGLRELAADLVTVRINERILAAAGSWGGLARFDDPTFADDLARVRRQASAIGTNLLLFGGDAIFHLGQAVWMAMLLAAFHPLACAAVLLACLPQVVLEWMYHRTTTFVLYLQASAGRRLEYYRDVLFDPLVAREVRFLDLGRFFGHLYDQTAAPLTTSLSRTRMQRVPAVALAGMLATSVSAGVVVAAVWETIRGLQGVGSLVLYGGAALGLQLQLRQTGIALGALPEVLTYLPSLRRVLDTRPDLPTTIRHAKESHQLAAVNELAFEDVTFTYPGTQRPALNRVSFTLQAGECVALLGENGAGKSTIVKLIARFYDPDAGRITVNGLDLREYDLGSVRHQIAILFQDFSRFDLTVRENILPGERSRATLSRVRRAAERAGLAPLIEAMANGYETRLGREFGGRELSGGEWQRLALARALAREDASLLVLDEPSAALDIEIEHELSERLREIRKGRITVLISHRLSTVRVADRLIVLRDGRIVEEGTHDQLLASGGEYASLFRTQARRYLGGSADTARERSH